MNVSEGFQLRTVYKKKVKPSKLDGLLERRVKQFTLEEKQRLGRIRQAAIQTKTATAKPTVNFEGYGKQQFIVSPCVKQEGANPEMKNPVVKKLDFEQEQMEKKPDNLEVRANATVSKHTDNSTLENNEFQKAVNGEPLKNQDLSSKNNCISDSKESKELGVGVNGKKRGYEDVLQGGGEVEAESIEQSRNSSVQMNGNVVEDAAADFNMDPVSQIQGDTKEAILMNGNLHNDSSNGCPPPAKVLKLENGATSRPVSVNDNAATDSELSRPNIGGCGLKIAAEDQPNRSIDSTATNKQSSCDTAVLQKVSVADSTTDLAKNTSMMISKEYSTRDQVSLLKFSKSKKARSGTALPSYRKFVTKSSKKSIFILPNDDLKKLARRGSIREVPIFSYSAKPAPVIWPYPSPRPTFGITWRLVFVFCSWINFI